jgi:hypothetical protein
MDANLATVLDRSRQMIQEALIDARAELETLQARQLELEELIRQAETALGSESSASPEMTLHKAIAHVLRANENHWMTARELADAVTAQGLYRKRDGSPLEANQVHARTNNYADLFEKEGANIRLREKSRMLNDLPNGMTSFTDDDAGFFGWLDSNPEGWFINTEREPNPNYLVLHRTGGCGHFKGAHSGDWTHLNTKICSSDQTNLDKWAKETVRGEVTLCRDCFRSSAN